MSSLSQFFQVPTDSLVTTKGRSTYFTSSGTVSVPSNVSYMAYGVMGAGSNGLTTIPSPSGCCCAIAGNGGGFSWWDGAVTCASPFSVCAIVGASNPCKGIWGPTYTCCAPFGGASCVTGVPTVICATGGFTRSSAFCTPSPRGGVGSGGLINTCGGVGGNCCELLCCSASSMGGGGAGGLLGNGGAGGVAIHYPPPANPACGSSAGGGGMGSGGGGGGTLSWLTGSAAKGGAGGGDGEYRECVNGISFGGTGLASPAAAKYCKTLFPVSAAPFMCQYHIINDAQTDRLPGLTVDGRFSETKTFFSAAGSGASAISFSCCAIVSSSPALAGGGGAAVMDYSGPCLVPAGFGGGSGAHSNLCQNCSHLNAFGGGGGIDFCLSSTCGGPGFVAIEWWD